MLRLLLPVMALLLLQGCSEESDPQELSVNFYAETPEMFLSSAPSKGRVTAMVTEGVRAAFMFVCNTRKADVYFYGIDLGEGRGDYVFRDLDWDFSMGTPTVERIITADIAVSDPGEKGAATITDVKIVYYSPNGLDDHQCRGVAMSFAVDGITYTAYPETLYCQGTTVLTDRADGSRDILYVPALAVAFNPSAMTAAVTIDGLSIDGMGIANNGVQCDATLTLTPGGYTLAASRWALNDSVTIEDFAAEGVMNEGLDVSYVLKVGERTLDVEAYLQPNRFDTPTVHAGKEE